MAQALGTDAPKAPNRLQGAKSSVEDLLLRSDGRPTVAIEVGPGITEPPTLTRTIDGASSVSIGVFDPEGTFLRNSLLTRRWDAELDGLAFRYSGLAKDEQRLTLTLEDAWVAMLKEMRGPVKVLRKNSTRAEFIKRLVEAACPGLEFFCPQLHRKQPIGTKAEKKESATEKKERKKEDRGKGIGDSYKHLKVKGLKATTTQRELAETALDLADQGNAPFVCRVAVIAALIDETDMGAVDSNNVLEGEGSGEGAPIGSAEDEISGFLFGKPAWTGTAAVDYYKSHPSATYYEIAQAVQASGAGKASKGRDNYGQFGAEAAEWVKAFEGGEGVSGSITVTEPYRFEVEGKTRQRKHPETYWEAIKRLANEVNWRFFIIGNRAYFMPETELFRSMVRLAIDPETSGIEDVSFEYNIHGEVTEVTVTALMDQWKPPPGSVVTLAGYGPASLGFGDAPGGTSTALSENKSLATGEGRGRYLVSTIEIPVTSEDAQRIGTITLKAPTVPLPEPQAKTKDISVGTVGIEGNKTVERILSGLERAAALKRGYGWGGEDPFSPGGVDCSGCVSFALRIGGFMEGRTDTLGLAAFGEPGPGKWITVYDHANTGDPHTEHCAIDVAGEVYESGGGPENSNPNGGLGKVDASQVTEFLKQFEIKRHPKGY